MMLWLVELPLALGLSLFLLLTVALGLGAFLLARWWLGGHVDSESQQFAVNLIRVCGALLALLLSFSLAEAGREWREFREAVELEAAQIVDIYYDLDRYDTPRAAEAQQLLLAYTRTIVGDEWQSLASDHLSNEAFRLFEALQDHLFDLEAADARQQALLARLLQDADEISDHRQARLQRTRPAPPRSLLVALVGFVVTMSFLGILPTPRRPFVLIALVCLFVGVVLYTIVAIADPFAGPLAVSPEPFEIILSELEEVTS
jgi:hypothetical protein